MTYYLQRPAGTWEVVDQFVFDNDDPRAEVVRQWGYSIARRYDARS